jgi:hypothetical protein
MRPTNERVKVSRYATFVRRAPSRKTLDHDNMRAYTLACSVKRNVHGETIRF